MGQAGGILCNQGFCITITFPSVAPSSWSGRGWRIQPPPPTSARESHTAETGFRQHQVKNTWFSDKSSVPKWEENPGKMQQARLVAGFQHEHLPSEESGEESRLIHPGHTSISSSCYWAGLFPFSVFLSAQHFCRSLGWSHIHRDHVGWPGRPHCVLWAPGTSPAAAGRSGWRGDQGKSLEPPRVCSVLTHSKQPLSSVSPHSPSLRRSRRFRASGKHRFPSR